MVSCPCALVISIPLSFFAGLGGASHEGILIKGSNYLETLSKTKTVVFDKTGTLTQGVFDVTGVHHNQLPRETGCWNTPPWRSAPPPTPSARACSGPTAAPLTASRVTDIQEFSGNGVVAKVDGVTVAVGNDKLMEKLGIAWHDCHSVGTIIHLALDGQYAGHIVISDVVKPHAQGCHRRPEAHRRGKDRHAHRRLRAKVADQVAAELGRGRGPQRAAARR